MSLETNFIFTGDSFITRRLPENFYPGFEEIRAAINKYHVRFNNLEMTIHDKKGYAEAVSGGTWAMAEPAVLDGLAEYGFNMYNTANNHSLDYGHGGLLATIENLENRGLIYAGTGENLYEAGKPCYLETENSRVAMIGVCSSFSINSPAGNQRIDMKGRPGLNPLRFSAVYHVTKEHYESLEKLAEATGINATVMRSIRLGYTPPWPEGQLNFAGKSFLLGDENKEVTTPNTADMARIMAHIDEAKRQADYVIVSIHSHEFKDNDVTKPAEFIEAFAKTCIDKGADAVVGHGPHEVRGIEIYNGKPIFYSLGNFIFQTEIVEYQPADAYENHKMENTATVGQYMDKRSHNGTRGYNIQPHIWLSVMAGMEMKDGRLKQIELYPIDLHMDYPRSRKGFPELTKDNYILEHIQKLSEVYGTKMTIKDGKAIIEL